MPSLFLFMFMYMMSFVMVIGSEDWFLVWLGLEINMMAFLIMVYRRCSIKVIESCISYFFIQSMGSAILVSLLYSESISMGSLYSLILSYKIGAGPFFYWFPSVCSGLTWGSCYILMLFQKLLPLCLIFMLIHWILWLIVIMSLIMGVLGSFNQSNIKEIMAYSSIHHLGWIMLIMMKGDLMWMVYLMLYSIMLMSVLILLMKNEIVNFFTMYMYKNKMWFVVSMLSIAGMPPLLGFFLKWMVLTNIINLSMLFLFVLLIVSVIMLYVYIRIVYDIIMGGGSMGSWISSKELKYNGMLEIVSMMGMIGGMMFMYYLFM